MTFYTKNTDFEEIISADQLYNYVDAIGTSFTVLVHEDTISVNVIAGHLDITGPFGVKHNNRCTHRLWASQGNFLRAQSGEYWSIDTSRVKIVIGRRE